MVDAWHPNNTIKGGLVSLTFSFIILGSEFRSCTVGTQAFLTSVNDFSTMPTDWKRFPQANLPSARWYLMFELFISFLV